MAYIYFHDLPVYRLTSERYYFERARFIDDFVKSIFAGCSSNPETIKRTTVGMEQSNYDKYGPWQFNEIVGYVRLHFLGNRVRGEYFVPIKRRHVLTRTR